jgi:hypothetical protein
MTAVTLCAVTPSQAILNHEGKGSGKLCGVEGTNYITEPAASDDDNKIHKNNDDNEFRSLVSRLINAAMAATAVNNNADNVKDTTLLSYFAWLPHLHSNSPQLGIHLNNYQNTNNYLDFYHTAAKKNLQTEAEISSRCLLSRRATRL